MEVFIECGTVVRPFVGELPVFLPREGRWRFRDRMQELIMCEDLPEEVPADWREEFERGCGHRSHEERLEWIEEAMRAATGCRRDWLENLREEFSQEQVPLEFEECAAAEAARWDEERPNMNGDGDEA